jgi:saccharopine dehydrogenase-like NADP-dependent oxidoreductase
LFDSGAEMGLRDLIGGPSNLTLIAADVSDPASLKAMADSAKVIISTVGPYQLYGEGVVAACAAAGTDYADLCGEPAWMAAMIRKYGDAAQASGARIVFSASTPFLLIWESSFSSSRRGQGLGDPRRGCAGGCGK